MLTNFVFIPTEEQTTNSNIFQLMKKCNTTSLDELSKKASKNIEWFWQQVDNDIGIVWDKPYQKVLDTSKGIPWSEWFIGGMTNIYKSSVEKFVKSEPTKVAYYFESEDGTKSKITYKDLDLKV